MSKKTILSRVMLALWVAAALLLVSSCDNLFGPDGGGNGGAETPENELNNDDHDDDDQNGDQTDESQDETDGGEESDGGETGGDNGGDEEGTDETDAEPEPDPLFVVNGVNYFSVEDVQKAIDQALEAEDNVTIDLLDDEFKPDSALEMELQGQDITLQGAADAGGTTLAAPLRITGSGSVTVANITIDGSKFDHEYGIRLEGVDLSGDGESVVLTGFEGGEAALVIASNSEAQGLSFKNNSVHVWIDGPDIANTEVIRSKNSFDAITAELDQAIWGTGPGE